MAELVRKQDTEIIPETKEPEEIAEEVAPPASVPTLTEEAVDDFKEELKKIDDEKQRKKDALRARVKAAQERARKARQKQAQEEAERLRRQKEEEKKKKVKKSEPEPKAPITETFEPPPYEVYSPTVAAPPMLQQKESFKPAPPPPAFFMEEQKEEESPPPPSYDMFDQLTVKAPPMQPSNSQSFLKQSDLPPVAPPPMIQPPPDTTAEFENMPSAPPVLPVPAPIYQAPIQTHTSMGDMPPPSFVQYEQNEIADAVHNENDTERMVQEQKEILEQLEREKAANDKAIAEAATSGLFESESIAETPQSRSVPTATTSSRSNRSSTQYNSENTISIGPNTKVTLRGEEQTRAAINNGTAMIVQCINCRNWMQVANTATLMFCPSCSTISRVEPQHQITSLDEAKVLMAHKRKKERKEEKERKLKEYREMTWGQYVKSFFVTVESTDTTPTSTTSTATDSYSSSRTSSDRFQTAAGFSREDYEDYYDGGEEETRQSLLPVSTFETEQEPPPAQIAEKRPLHSCLTGLTKTLTGGSGYPGNRGNEIDGIDSTALLSVTRVGRRTH